MKEQIAHVNLNCLQVEDKKLANKLEALLAFNYIQMLVMLAIIYRMFFI